MIRRKKAVIVLLTVFLACFVFFGMKAKTSLFQASATRENLVVLLSINWSIKDKPIESS